MNRDSFLYKVRRKMQQLAYVILPAEFLSKIYCRIVIHENVNIKNSRTLNEKLQWYKLYYCPNTPLVVKCADKYQVRSYIENKGYGELLTNLIGVWEKVEDINWDKLPKKFVMKCTHGCGYNILCKDKGKLTKEVVENKLRKWLKEDFSAFNIELHYGKIKPRRIICEEYLGDVITDYKFFCFNGEPHFFYVSSDLINDRQAEMGFFNMDGSKIPLIREDYKDIGNVEIPICLHEMVNVAKDLAKDFPFVRVDFFLLGGTYKFAELTFTPAAAMMPINPKKYDIEWGELLSFSDTRRECIDTKK